MVRKLRMEGSRTRFCSIVYIPLPLWPRKCFASSKSKLSLRSSDPGFSGSECGPVNEHIFPWMKREGAYIQQPKHSLNGKDHVRISPSVRSEARPSLNTFKKEGRVVSHSWYRRSLLMASTRSNISQGRETPLFHDEKFHMMKFTPTSR